MWVSLVYGGIKGLQYYDPKNEKWGQAHMNARWVIFRVLHEAKVATIEWSKKDDEDYFEIKMDYEKIRTEGKKAMGHLLT